MLVLLAVLSLYCAVGGPGVVAAQLRAPALATLFYVANWQEIVADSTYFHQFTAPSPLQHTWSLAIEEQYYVLWPLLLGGLTWTFSRLRGGRVGLIATVALLAVASATWMSVAAHLFGPNRAYLGTDTRAWELLLGGIGALIWPLHRRSPDHSSRLWAIIGPLGLIGVALGAARAGGESGPPWWIWNGGLVAIALCAGLVILSCVLAPDGVLARVLRLPPLRALGLISYSLYLWHWPAIVLMTPDTTGLEGAGLLAARLAAMTAASCASYFLVERPLRRADWSRLARRLRIPAVSFAAAGMAATAVVILAGTVTAPQAGSGQVAITRPPVTANGGGTAGVSLPPATPQDPYRLWILGDSVMQDSSLGVQAALGSTADVSTVVNTSFGGWGLSTDKVWPNDALETLATYHPQIVLGTWSWDNAEALDHPGAYVQQLEAAMRVLLDHGVQLVVLPQFPQPGPNLETTLQLTTAQRMADWAQTTRGQDAWDAAARKAVAAFPGHALYLRTDTLFAPHGYFLTWMRTAKGTWVRAREARQRTLLPVRGGRVRCPRDPGPHSGAPPRTDVRGMGERVMDPRSPVRRPTRSLPR